jgi:hypothetical protein
MQKVIDFIHNESLTTDNPIIGYAAKRLRYRDHDIAEGKPFPESEEDIILEAIKFLLFQVKDYQDMHLRHMKYCTYTQIIKPPADFE